MLHSIEHCTFFIYFSNHQSSILGFSIELTKKMRNRLRGFSQELYLII